MIPTCRGRGAAARGVEVGQPATGSAWRWRRGAHGRSARCASAQRATGARGGGRISDLLAEASRHVRSRGPRASCHQKAAVAVLNFSTMTDATLIQFQPFAEGTVRLVTTALSLRACACKGLRAAGRRRRSRDPPTASTSHAPSRAAADPRCGPVCCHAVRCFHRESTLQRRVRGQQSGRQR